MATYSFLDVVASLIGPGAVISLGDGAGNSDEGINIEMVEDINTMTGGADGSVMQSLHAGRRGIVTVNLLKVSPVNSLLTAAYQFQRISSSNHGQNVISVADKARGDLYMLRQCAFARFPNNAYSKDGGHLAWRFHCGFVDPILGIGQSDLFAA